MYLASFGTPDGPIAQGLVSLPSLPVVPTELKDRWWHALAAAVAGLDAVRYGGVSMRVVLRPGQQLRRTLIVSVADERERQLRRWLATLTRLETLIPGSAHLPITRAEYDADAQDFPPLRCRVASWDSRRAGRGWPAIFAWRRRSRRSWRRQTRTIPPRLRRERTTADRRDRPAPQSAPQRARSEGSRWSSVRTGAEAARAGGAPAALQRRVRGVRFGGSRRAGGVAARSAAPPLRSRLLHAALRCPGLGARRIRLR